METLNNGWIRKTPSLKPGGDAVICDITHEPGKSHVGVGKSNLIRFTTTHEGNLIAVSLYNLVACPG